MSENDEQRTGGVRELISRPINDVIAELKLIAVSGGEQRNVVLQIGRSYAISEDEGACPVATWGLDGRYPDIHGAGTFQALSLAVKFLEVVLTDTIESGSTRFYFAGPDVNEDDDEPLTIATLKPLFGNTPRKRKSQTKPD